MRSELEVIADVTHVFLVGDNPTSARLMGVNAVSGESDGNGSRGGDRAAMKITAAETVVVNAKLRKLDFRARRTPT
jgi:hypothetical protein